MYQTDKIPNSNKNQSQVSHCFSKNGPQAEEKENGLDLTNYRAQAQYLSANRIEAIHLDLELPNLVKKKKVTSVKSR